MVLYAMQQAMILIVIEIKLLNCCIVLRNGFVTKLFFKS